MKTKQSYMFPEYNQSATSFTRTATYRIKSLDGLRAVAIAVVLIGHTSHSKGFPWSNWRFNFLANAGVRLFFVLSGFLITTLLVLEREKREDVSLIQFYKRRAFRIFPAFYLYLFFISALSLFGLLTIPRRELLLAYVYLSNFQPGQYHLVGHLWSLSVEEQFYLLWPAVIAFGNVKARNIVLLTAAIMPPLLRCFMSSRPGLSPYVDQSFFTICDTLAAGCALALYRDELHSWPGYQKLLTRRGLLTLVIVCLLILESAKFRFPSFQVTQSLLNICLALIIDICIVLQPSILNARPVILFGTWSYSIYLWQQLFCSSTGHWWELFPINILISVLVAYCSFRFIEQPALRLRKRQEQAIEISDEAHKSVA